MNDRTFHLALTNSSLIQIFLNQSLINRILLINYGHIEFFVLKLWFNEGLSSRNAVCRVLTLILWSNLPNLIFRLLICRREIFHISVPRIWFFWRLFRLNHICRNQIPRNLIFRRLEHQPTWIPNLFFDETRKILAYDHKKWKFIQCSL